MKRALLTALILATAWPAFAQTTPERGIFTLGHIDFGIQVAHPDTDSSKFREYRDLLNGPVFPFFRLLGEQKVRYDLIIENAIRDDGRYRLIVDAEPIRIKVDYNRIPHRFGNDGRTLLHETARGVLEIPDTIQRANQTALEAQFAQNRNGVNFPFLSALVAPQLAAANRIDLALLRERGNVEVGLTPGQPLDVRLSYFQERRSGTRAAGTAFGFGNVVESPEPIQYRTQDIGASAEYAQSWGLVRGAAHYNWFSNAIGTLTFDNPFRATDSTDASAYTGPGPGSIAGPSRGRIDLPADNQAVTGSVGFLLRLPANSRLTADVSASRWTQDREFMPHTINSAIGPTSNPAAPFKADDPANLPERSLDGRINVVSQSYLFTSRPLPALGFTARYRVYDLSNDTRRIEFPGHVRMDAVWIPGGRISVPYGYKTHRADATVSYDLGPATLEGGYRYVKFNRTFRETRETTENTFLVAANVHPLGWAQARASYETGKRNRDEYDFARSELASRAEAEMPSNLPELRRFDQAKKDLDRFNGLLQLSPVDNLSFSLSYWYNKDDYTREPVVAASGLHYGLVNAKNESLTAEADYSPGDRWNFYGFYSYEKIATFQRGRQSGATPSRNPLDDWTSDIEDKVYSFGGGGTVALVPEKLDFRAFGRYQKVDGNNALARPPAAPVPAISIPDFDDTKLWNVGAEFAYNIAKSWSLALGGWLEYYRVKDSATTSLTNYVPASFFLAANDSDYNARVGYVRASYHW